MTIAQKRKALDGLHYEIWMFNESFALLKNLRNNSGISREEKILLTNIYLECFLLHARNLVYFLKDRIDQRDIGCFDFGIVGVNINLPVYNTLEEINKYLAHLSQERILSPKPKWRCSKIKEEINNKLSNFLDGLSLELFPTAEGKTKEDFESLIM
ncbi:MAG: hypothetical protein ACKKMV_00360 [Candidatus Nealsonbacteria bacterium]